jgi:DNA-binding transcriptional ArsR family regulator
VSDRPTKGNLSSHLSKLEAAGYVRVVKEFVGKIPWILLSLATGGRQAFRTYRQHMKQVLDELPE